MSARRTDSKPTSVVGRCSIIMVGYLGASKHTTHGTESTMDVRCTLDYRILCTL